MIAVPGKSKSFIDTIVFGSFWMASVLPFKTNFGHKMFTSPDLQYEADMPY